MRAPKGTIIIDSREVADTAQCVHCNAHFVMERGSGKKRGWCMNCGGITCGGVECSRCVPFEKKLDMYEKGQIQVLR